MADERFTMRFDDIGEPPIYWCASCGAEAQAINELITRAFDERGPGFAKEFAEAIEREQTKQ